MGCTVAATSRYLHADAMGNIVLATTTNGGVAATYLYSPFGRVLAETPAGSGETAFVGRFAFSSKEHDRETGLGYYGFRYLNPSTGRWLSRDPLGSPGFEPDVLAYSIPAINLYQFARNNSLLYVDPLGLADWRLDLSDHGGPHIQLGDSRWDALTLEPLEHKGVIPSRLTKSQLKELADSGVLDRILKNVPNSVVAKAGKELFGEQFAKQGAKCLTRNAQKQLAKSILKKIPVVLLVFAAADYAEGGVEQAINNAVIPGDLIQDVIDDGQRRYDEWSDNKAKAIWEKRCRCAGLSEGDL